jgi:hypothetical protein
MSDNLDPFAYDITAIELVSSTGYTTNIKFMVQDFNLYESIFNAVVSGDMRVWDGNNILTDFSLHGNEYLIVRFTKADLRPIEKYFRIYKISNVSMRNLNTFEYMIYFCSEEFILNQQKRISKSYKNITNSQIVEDILTTYLSINEKKIVNIEETVLPQSLIIPNLKPFEAINWISTFSLNSKLSSAFVFYENIEGFNFRSLASMFQEEAVKKLQVTAKNVQTEEDKNYTNTFTPDRYEFPQLFDILKTISTGGYSSQMLAINPLGREHATLRYDSVEGNFDQLNKFIPYNDATNRFNETLTDGSTYLRYFPTFQGALVDDWLLQRASQFSLLNSMQMNIQIPGDPELRSGSVIDIEFPFFQPIDAPSKTEEDGLKSGKYLITGIRHRIIDSLYISYLELSKDSNKAPIAGAVNSTKFELAKKL